MFGLFKFLKEKCLIAVKKNGKNDPYVAADVETAGGVAGHKGRDEEAKVKNEAFLKANPEHILVVIGAKRAMFSEQELREAFMSRVSATTQELDGYLEKVMQCVEVVRLNVKGAEGEVMYSTRVRISQESRMVSEAVEMASDRLNVDPKEGLENLFVSIVDGDMGLDDSQYFAARRMLDDKRFTLISGFAGTGKTYTIEKAAEVWIARGYEVIGGSASDKTTRQLDTIDGFEAASLASWEASWDRNRFHQKGKFVFIMDDAGMIGGNVWARIQHRVNAMGGKLIAVGDPEGLQPVNDTSAFRAIQRALSDMALSDKA